MGPRAVAVIRSGLDGDASAAFNAIETGGGLMFAQSDASFDSMPRSALQMGHIDHTIPVDEIAQALAHLPHELIAGCESK